MKQPERRLISGFSKSERTYARIFDINNYNTIYILRLTIVDHYILASNGFSFFFFLEFNRLQINAYTVRFAQNICYTRPETFH